MGTIGPLSRCAGKARGRKVGDPRDMFDWSPPTGRKHGLQAVLATRVGRARSAAFPLARLAPAFAVTSLAGEHYREALNPACHAVGVTKASAGKPYPTA